MKTCHAMTNQEARPLIALALAGLLLMALSSMVRGEDEDQPVHINSDGSTYYMMADVAQGFDWSNVQRWVGAQNNIAMKGVVLVGATAVEAGKWALNVGDASVKNAKADPLEALAQSYVVLRLTGNDPADWFDDDEEDTKGFKTSHIGLEPKTGPSRTGVAVDRHGCSVETSSSTTPITVDASFFMSGSSDCKVTVGSSDEE